MPQLGTQIRQFSATTRQFQRLKSSNIQDIAYHLGENTNIANNH